jgi:hypothetical protein
MKLLRGLIQKLSLRSGREYVLGMKEKHRWEESRGIVDEVNDAGEKRRCSQFRRIGMIVKEIKLTNGFYKF